MLVMDDVDGLGVHPTKKSNLDPTIRARENYDDFSEFIKFPPNMR